MILRLILATAIMVTFIVSTGYSKDGDWRFRQNIVKTAKSLMGTLYQYGGKKRNGFDCSGFTSFVYHQNGVNLPRSSKEQYKTGRWVSLRNAKAGDLIFFNINGRGVSHVGIYLGEGKFIHSPRTGKRVKIASLKINYWKKRFVTVKRYWER